MASARKRSLAPDPRPRGRAAAGGGPDAASLYERYREPVRRHLARLVPPPEVDDLVQEVFVKVQRSLAGFRGQSSPATWIYRIATHTAYDHLRSPRHRESRPDLSRAAAADPEAGDTGSSAGPEPSQPAEAPGRMIRSEMHDCVREYIGRLPPPYREVLWWKEIDGLTNEQIAARRGLSLDAAKIRLHRARAALRRLFDAGCEFYRTPENTLGCDRRSDRPPKRCGC